LVAANKVAKQLSIIKIKCAFFGNNQTIPSIINSRNFVSGVIKPSIVSG
jgi:hypothetical protein